MVMHTDLVLVNMEWQRRIKSAKNKETEPKNEKQTTTAAAAATSAATATASIAATVAVAQKKNFFFPCSSHLRIINSVKIWHAEIKKTSEKREKKEWKRQQANA